MKTTFFYVFGWIGLMFIGIFNGIVRKYCYGEYMSELYAHQLSTLIAIVLFGIYIWLLSGIHPIQSTKQALIIAAVWLLVTVLFEFIFGHYCVGHSWDDLFQDYNLFAGRVWLVVLIWMCIAPYIFYKIRS